MTLSAGNVTRMVASYSYDDIGRLVSLKRSGNAGIVNYAYNIRNWLKEAKSDRFCQNLLYENTGAYPCFNGNISRMQWQTSKDNVLRGYDFAYDGSFDFKDGANADVEYLYDANGALVKDLNKGISNIEYDVLGNLKCITFSNGFKTKYVYDAAGNKLRTTHESAVTNTTDYVGNFVFEDGKLSKYLFDGGYCSFDQNQNPVFHNDYEGTSGAAAAYHELLEQNELQKYGFPTDVTSESVVKAHEYALRKEHMFLGNPKAVNLIDKDNNCIEIIDDKRTVRIPFVNFNIIRKK